jgi:preprotein translocase subunit SecA
VANILTNLFGSRNQRLLKRLSKKVGAINKLEPELQNLSDDSLKIDYILIL